MYAHNSSIDFPVTKYYFDTFVVGAHHSISHLVRDLKSRKDLALKSVCKENTGSRNEELLFLVDLIDAKLDELSSEDIPNIEVDEPQYWINHLGRQAALEISTYGRVRPETMNLLMCLPEDNFVAAMSIGWQLSNKIQKLAASALEETNLPPKMPVVS